MILCLGQRGCLGIVGLFSCLSSCCSIVLGFCILSFVVVFVFLRLWSSGLSWGGPGHRRIRSMAGVLAGSRSRPSLQVSRLVSDTISGCLVVWLLFLVPFAKGWRIVARASRSADPTSLMLRYHSVIAQTRERNCWKRETAGSSSDDFWRINMITSKFPILRHFAGDYQDSTSHTVIEPGWLTAIWPGSTSSRVYSSNLSHEPPEACSKRSRRNSRELSTGLRQL